MPDSESPLPGRSQDLDLETRRRGGNELESAGTSSLGSTAKDLNPTFDHAAAMKYRVAEARAAAQAARAQARAARAQAAKARPTTRSSNFQLLRDVYFRPDAHTF